MRINKYISTLIICPAIMLILYLSLNAGDGTSSNQDIVITSSGEINIGQIFLGMSKDLTLYDQYVKFEITCKKDMQIKIIKYEDPNNQGITYSTEWKQGPYTGFEYPYSNGVYSTKNKKYYVTVKVKSIIVSSDVKPGTHSFSPSISVSMTDL
jgi:uncharacterized protein (DUF608 family)